MHIVTAANSNLNYPALLDNCVKSARALGYKVLVYDLGGLGKGDPKFKQTDLNPILACWQKPRVMLDALNKVPKDALLVWVDADVIFLRTIDEMDSEDYDVGLLVRDGFRLRYEAPGRHGEYRQKKATSQFRQKLNTGTMFVYNNPEGRRFLRDWVGCFPAKPPRGRRSLWKHGDQKYLNDMLIEYWSQQFYYDEIGTKLEDTTLQYHDTVIKFVRTHDYSNYEMGVVEEGVGVKLPESVKLLHHKGETIR
jgi:hypothetical protein